MTAANSSPSETASTYSIDSHSDTKLPIKKKRQSKPKVKTGCGTCKIRRIKCDEEKPICRKCTATGRVCDGYAAANGAYPTTVTVWDTHQAVSGSQNLCNPLLDFPGTMLEHRYLDLFIYRTASALSGSLESHFFKGLMPQVGNSEPTIRHAMVAVAALHERFETAADLNFNPVTGCGGFALQQYNKAISCLTKRLSEGPHSEEVTLMCCVLFISVEYLCGNALSAIKHLQSGNGILAAWRERNGYLEDEALCEGTNPNSTFANLAEIFNRITVQALLCGHPSSSEIASFTDIEASINSLGISIFQNLNEARTVMDHIMKVSLRFICLAAHYYRDPESPRKVALHQLREKLILTIESWFQFFKSLPTLTFSPKDLRSSSVLRVQIIISEIWLRCSLESDEMLFDTPIFESLFREAIEHASAIADLPPQSTPSLFSLDMGVVGTLYFIATKCRIPSVRRAALGLLAITLPRREGLWDASVVASVAARVIELEEEDLKNVGIFCDHDPCGEKRPPVSKRIVEAIIHQQEDGALASTETRQKVTFMYVTPEGEWRLRVEMLFWNREEQGWKPRHTLLDAVPGKEPPYSSMLGHWVPGFYP